MRSAEEKAAWREKMAGFVREIASLTKEEREARAARMPIINPEGHSLAAMNACLLQMQAGRGLLLSIVGGFRQWIRNGRHVRRGEHACGFIRVPLTRGGKQEGSASEGAAQSAEEPTIFFRWVPVFDVTQTDEGQGSKVEAEELAEATA